MLDEMIAYCLQDRFKYELNESATPAKKVSLVKNGSQLFSFSLKDRPEDFLVSENLKLETASDGARYTYILIEKTNMSTYTACRLISSALGVGMKDIGRSGLKDRRAIALQWLSLPGIWEGLEERIEGLRKPESESLRVVETKYGREPIGIGMHGSNSFRIALHDIPERMNTKPGSYVFPNYFDTQRTKLTSCIMGELLYSVKERKTDAVPIFLERIDSLPLRLRKADSKVRWACRLLGEKRDAGLRGVMERLSKAEKREYMAGLSSCLWSFKLSKSLKEMENGAEEILLKGNAIGTIVMASGKKDAGYVLQEQLGFRGKMIERPAFQTAMLNDVKWKKEGDAYSCLLDMELPKGCYATLFIKWLFAREVISKL